MGKVICPYCGKEAGLVDSAVIYGKSYGPIYLCPKCKAYVGCHKGTTKPMGRLADAELRSWRKGAHGAFDPIWKYGRFHGDRDAAYVWLSQQMGLPPSETHIGLFDVEQCKKTIDIMRAERLKGENYE